MKNESRKEITQRISEANKIKFYIDGLMHTGTVMEYPVCGRWGDFVGYLCKVKFMPPIIPFQGVRKIKVLGLETGFYCGDSNTIIENDLREKSIFAVSE